MRNRNECGDEKHYKCIIYGDAGSHNTKLTKADLII